MGVFTEKNTIRRMLVLVTAVTLCAAMLSGCGVDYLTQSVHDIGSAISGAQAATGETEELGLGGTVSELRSDIETGVGEAVTAYTVGEPQIVETVSLGRYAYGTLSEEDRVVYDQIYDAICTYGEDVPISTFDKDELRRIYECVLADHGEIFWVSGYTYHIWSRGDEIIGLTFSPNFTMDEEEREAMQGEIDAVVADWLEGLAPGSSDYDKAKYIYQTLIRNVAYDADSDNNQNIISVFINHATVCQGYANAVTYLAWLLGIQSAVVTGYANGQLHAWNLLFLDGAYYYMDTTWGNSSYMDLDDTRQRFVNFAYLNITSEEMSATHTAQVDFSLPECTAVEDNYYMREGRWFDTADMDTIGQLFGEAYTAGEETSSVKLAGSELYRSVHSYFIEDGHIADYCPGLTSIAYLESEEMGVLTLLF